MGAKWLSTKASPLAAIDPEPRFGQDTSWVWHLYSEDVTARMNACNLA